MTLESMLLLAVIASIILTYLMSIWSLVHFKTPGIHVFTSYKNIGKLLYLESFYFVEMAFTFIDQNDYETYFSEIGFLKLFTQGIHIKVDLKTQNHTVKITSFIKKDNCSLSIIVLKLDL